MAVDFTSSGVFRRTSVLLMDDCLLVLEQDGNRDRVRRILFDRVASVVAWKTFPWVWAGTALVLAGLSALLLLIGYAPLGWIATVLILSFVGCFVYLAYARLTHIRIERLGENHELKTIKRPGKIDDFLRRLYANIEANQQREIARAAKREQDLLAAREARGDSAETDTPGQEPEAGPPDEAIPGETPPPLPQ